MFIWRIFSVRNFEFQEEKWRQDTPARARYYHTKAMPAAFLLEFSKPCAYWGHLRGVSSDVYICVHGTPLAIFLPHPPSSHKRGSEAVRQVPLVEIDCYFLQTVATRGEQLKNCSTTNLGECLSVHCRKATTDYREREREGETAGERERGRAKKKGEGKRMEEQGMVEVFWLVGIYFTLS